MTAQLVDADTDSHVWAEKYSGSIDDVFAIQEEISRKIVKALQVKLTDTESRAVAERPIDNAAAYECYLQARHEMFRFTPESLDRAERLVDAALELMGENALLLATRGMVSWYFVNFSIRPEERYLDEAASFAVRALKQDPNAFLGVFVRGLVAAKRGDLEAAVRDMRTAHELNPGDASVVMELARHLFSAGREHNDAGRLMELSIRADPLNPLNWAQRAWLHCGAGRLVEAKYATERALQLSERTNPARVYAAYALVLAGRRAEATAEFEGIAAAMGTSVYGSLSAFLAAAMRGEKDKATAHVTPQLLQSARWVEYLSWFLADGYALIGRHDDALGWLRQSVELGCINYPVLSKLDPLLESLRGDAEYKQLMEQVHRRWQVFDA